MFGAFFARLNSRPPPREAASTLKLTVILSTARPRLRQPPAQCVLRRQTAVGDAQRMGATRTRAKTPGDAATLGRRQTRRTTSRHRAPGEEQAAAMRRRTPRAGNGRRTGEDEAGDGVTDANAATRRGRKLCDETKPVNGFPWGPRRSRRACHSGCEVKVRAPAPGSVR